MNENPPKYYELIYRDEFSSYSDPELRAMKFTEDEPHEKHKEIMSEPPVYLTEEQVTDIVTKSDITLPPPPENDSLETLSELFQLYERSNGISDEHHQKHLEYNGNNTVGIFVSLLKEWGYDPDEQELKDLYHDAEIVALRIQYKYNRPRPYQIAKYYELPLTVRTSKDIDSPSYPCMEHIQAAIVALRCGQYVTYKQKVKLVKLTSKFAVAGLTGCCIFPSDTSSSLSLATEIFKNTRFGHQAQLKHLNRKKKKMRREKNKSKSYNSRVFK